MKVISGTKRIDNLKSTEQAARSRKFSTFDISTKNCFMGSWFSSWFNLDHWVRSNFSWRLLGCNILVQFLLCTNFTLCALTNWKMSPFQKSPKIDKCSVQILAETVQNLSSFETKLLLFQKNDLERHSISLFFEILVGCSISRMKRTISKIWLNLLIYWTKLSPKFS